MTTILFWVAVILLAAPDGTQRLIASNPLADRAACQQSIEGPGMDHIARYLAPQGFTPTDAYCVPVTADRREPIIAGPDV